MYFQLFYNAGRILTYSAIGAAVGWFGSLLAYANAFHMVMRIVLLCSDLFIIVVGIGTVLHHSNLNIMKLEFSGAKTIMAKTIHIHKHFPAWLAPFPIGIAMGFLPCGFAYAMVITAAQSTSPIRGFLTMLFFGLGTGPALLLMGGLAHWLSLKARSSMLRIAGALVSLMGMYNLARHLKMMGWELSGPLSIFCS